ncbi:MoaA/NifB/PqqE/SkfB family radical SAM enzyme [Desulfobaculum xiamenense]|uniref:MoaA/NifB/PqqE/SkfB family radical SAM enzyme n=1 Tax=Desulfobaculum xiamenense TaxID=995050 RepID=A0A846QDV5_9BACT|nr:radical SAM protein [Desulfobaculum xiamenense]NJB66558.1 MoaA/NifB/PqqE/SkfB family radical SAM enzyme [Desulfobaculum xiamenense]
MNEYARLRSELEQGLARVVRFGQEALFRSDRLDVNWLVTLRCNYNCSYCFGHDNRRGFFPPGPMLMQAADTLASLGRSRYHITITGGEPTLLPTLPALLSRLGRRLPESSTIHVLSNFGRTPDYFRGLASALDPSVGFEFSGTFHFERARRERFLTNVGILLNRGFVVNFRILAHPDFMREVYALHREAVALAAGGERLNVDVVPMRERNEQGEYSLIDSRYDRMAREWLECMNAPEDGEGNLLLEVQGVEDGTVRSYRLTGRQVDFYGLNRFKGMFCSVGRNSMSIDPYGFIDPSVCFRSIEYRKPNIYMDHDPLAMFGKPVVCPFESCACCVDQCLPKTSALH